MKVSVTQEGSVTVVAMEGKIDTDTCDEVESALLAEIDKGAKRMVIDLAAVNYISSAGLRSVLIAGKKIKALHGRMAFCDLQPPILDVFEASGFTTILTVCETRNQAIAACQA
jgi:anti-anti-sigma factor